MAYGGIRGHDHKKGSGVGTFGISGLAIRPWYPGLVSFSSYKTAITLQFHYPSSSFPANQLFTPKMSLLPAGHRWTQKNRVRNTPTANLRTLAVCVQPPW